MDDDFERRAISLRNESLLKTESLFAANREEWCDSFALYFEALCGQIRTKQDESTISATSFLEFTMLYTNFINRCYVSEAIAFDERRYLDQNKQFFGRFDLSFLFGNFDKLWDDLLTVRKRYVGKVSANEVKLFMMDSLPDFYSYFINIVRYAIADLVDRKPFADVARGETFLICVGEYMAKTEIVYIECKNKDAKALARRFGKRLKGEYAFEDYSDLNFSGCVFKFSEFNYAHFRRSCLNNVTFEGSALVGTSFYKAQMDRSCLTNCSIFEADFSYAFLRGARFANERGRAGLPSDDKWRHVGFLPVRFRFADLTNADFSGANLVGADFTGAMLGGVDFTNTVLDGAVFTGAVLD